LSLTKLRAKSLRDHPSWWEPPPITWMK
jgi:hypothetical protein